MRSSVQVTDFGNEVLTLPRHLGSMKITSRIVLLNNRRWRRLSTVFQLPMVQGYPLCISGLSLHVRTDYQGLEKAISKKKKKKQGDKQCLRWDVVSMNQNPSSKSWLKSGVNQKEGAKATRQSVIRLIFFNPHNTLCYHPHLLMRILRPRYPIIYANSHSQ